MNLSKIFTLLLSFSLVAVLMTSCGEDDPCEGLVCPTGFVCDEGVCVLDNSADPCGGCPAGFNCVNEECVEDLSSGNTTTLSGAITSDITLTRDIIYEIAGKVVVESGITITIEPGTIIKGRTGTGSLASAMIIARGAQIVANGTAAQPIIFTTVNDNIQLGQLTGSNLSELDNELWGGLIILGYAPISAKDGDTEALIEGLPGDEEYAKYGGTDAQDSSGSIQYVSVRHGGALIGEGNEINGVTFGGVGAGTVINHLEVAATLDDGIEMFGGTVNIDNVIISYQGDDGVDVDQNYSGTIDNFMVIHGGDDTDEALEIDGPEGSTYTEGICTLLNGTCIAKDQARTTGADFKSGAQAMVRGCSWIGYSKYIKVRSTFDAANGCAPIIDSYTKMTDAGTLTFNLNEIVSSTAQLSDMARVYADIDEGDIDCLTPVLTEYEAAVDMQIVSGDNTISATMTKGAISSEFDGWTLASAKSWY